eukprot:gnl/TRDRNA2_/TRDRNA2_165039_c0_seq8.p1 gnl/TRDRNA2_/TRDRNA2_165039_c0~~gnl/TRDRNA2_/TRDRNA2_165039_c0_seq8.p1  ORF type:complete len:165 (+),score=47.44 gnl/TRDRNA2_/TRDRNA2_165039_c0_seq8:145-639(+)
MQVANAEAADKKLEELIKLASPGPALEGAARQYNPVMFFANTTLQDMPSTCSGKMWQKPIAGKTMDGCASACDAEVHNCVGFSYFGEEAEDPLCFLFSKFESVTYYTGCKKDGASFLQGNKEKTPEVTCVAKFSEFSGTTLKPDPSGKCKQCFKKATQADRCYE